MDKSWKLLLILLAVSMLVIGGCQRDDDDYSDGSAVTDQEALAEILAEDQELEGFNAWNGDDDDILADGGGLDEPVTPLRWGRSGRWRRETVTVDIVGDTAATITRIAHFAGHIRILVDTTDGEQTVLNKRMHNILTRKAQAIRVAWTPNPRRNWRITAVTPEVMESADPNPHTVNLTQVQLYRAGANDTLPALVADITNPLETYYTRTNLPTVVAGDEIIVYATVDPANPVVGVLHPRAFNLRPHPRFSLADDGQGYDVLAGDGIYTGAYTIRARGGVFQAGVDMIDYDTLYDSELPYDADGWAIPYRVAQR